MKKFLRTLMLTVAMMLPFASQAQNTLTVADSTATNSYVPVYGLYVDDFVRCQTIYPASMLTDATAGDMTGNAILGLTYYLSTPASASWGSANFVVNIKEVSGTTLSGFNDMTGATTVYTGPLDGTQSTMEITFTMPYIYMGGNLLIEIYNTLEGTYKSASFYGINADGASWQGNNGSSVSAITGSARNFIPKTTFSYGNPPACLPVTALSVSNITSTSASLSWSGNAAAYVVYEYANADSNGFTTTDTFYNFNTLLPNTVYNFGVVADCGADGESVMQSISFRTSCGAIALLPFTEDFETVPSGSYQMPFCWNRYTSAFTTSATYPYSYSSTTGAHGGSRSLYFYGSTTSSYPDTMVAILPELDVNTYPMNGNRLTFWAKMGAASNSKKVYVGTLSNPADPTTFTLIDSVLVSGSTHTLYSVPLSTANASDAYVALVVLKGTGTMYIDDVTLEEMPSCLEITGLTVDSVTSSSVSLSWNDPSNSGATYSVYNMEAGSPVLVASNVSGTTYTVTGLNANTQYTFGVQANCTAGDAAIMTVSALTACAEETMPWSENFDNWASKSPCWSFLSGAYNGGNGTPTVNTSAWTLNTSYGNYITISGKALTMNIYSTNRYWAVTPPINITGDAMLSVDVAVSAWSAATPNYDVDDTLAFAVSTDGGSTFTNLRVLDNTEINALNGTYTTINVPVIGYNGQTVRFAIFGGSSATGGDNRIAIDNVAVGEVPTCMPVTGLSVSNITADSATLSWSGSASAYAIIDLSDTTVVATTTDTFYVFSDLTPMTYYTFGVVASCNGDQSAMVAASFSTACSAVAIPFTEDFEATSATLGCWGVANIDANTGLAGSYDAYSGSSCFKFSYNTNPPQYLISPELSGTDNGLVVSFMYKVQSTTYPESFQLGYSTTTNDVTAFTWGTEQTNLVNTTYDSYSEILPAGVKYVAVKYTANDMYALFIDSMVFNLPPNCLPVSDLAVDSATATSIFLSWNGTASSYSIYSSTGAVIATGVTTTSYEITGLTPTTGYTFGVVANCGSDNSDVVTINATTACSGTTCFIEINGADSYGDGWNGNAINIIQNGAVVHTFTLAAGTSILSEHVPVCSDYPVNFAWVLGNFPDEVYFEIKNAGIITYTITNATSLTDGAVFHTINNACSGCTVPVVTVDTVTETSATISWTGTAISYDVYNDTILVANVTTNSYTFTGLTPRTTYNFGVVAVCGVDDESNMANVSVVTPGSCPVYNLPFNETFNANSGTRNCWTLVDADNDGNNWTTMYEGVDNEMMLSFSYDDATYDALTPDNWLISPKVHSTAGSNVTMSWTVAAGDATYSAEHYGVYVSTTSTDTSAFTLLQEWTLSSATSNVMNLDLSAYAGQDIYVAFRHFNCTDMYVLIIDDVNIYEGAFVPDTLTVTFAVNNATMGTTTPAPGTYQYINGDTVQFSATPNAGYRFIGWAWTIDGETDTLDANYISASFPVDAFISYGSMTFTALFEAGNPDSTTITYAVNDATMGTITPAPGTYAIYVGGSIDASATANAGYELTAWVFDIYLGGSLYDSDTIWADDEDFANPMHFGIMSQNFVDYNASIAITAVFAPAAGPATYTVIVRTSNGEMGNVNPAGVNTVVAGETFTVTATPNTGYHFVSWTMGDSVISTDNPYTFTVTGDTYLAANFEANDSTVTYYEVRVSANSEMGTVTSDVPVGQVAEGTVMTVTATANEGYRFLNWVTDGGVVVSTENPYTFTVTANVNLVAMFERIEGIGDVEAIDFNVYSVDNRIVVKGVENQPVYVYDVTGRTVKSVAKAAETVEFTVPSAGVYLVKVATAAAKRVVVVR